MALGVFDTLMVAALGNGNDTVGVIDTVYSSMQRSDNASPMRWLLRTWNPCKARLRERIVAIDVSGHGVGQAHGIGPVPERGHHHGIEHA